MQWSSVGAVLKGIDQSIVEENEIMNGYYNMYILDLIENGSFLVSFGGSSHYFPFRFDSARRKGS